MKNSFRTRIFTFSAALAAGALLTSALAATPDAGYVDFGKFTPTSGGEFVEVNVTSNIVMMVSNLAKKDAPEIAEILKGLKGVHVHVLGLNEENRADMRKRVDAVRAQLDKSGWERVVTVMKDQDDVGVFMKTRGPEAVEGVVVTVLEGKGQAVFVNVVGDIRPEKLATIGERFNIEPLKHLPAAPKDSAQRE